MSDSNKNLQLELDQLEAELNRVELLKKIRALLSKLRPLGKSWDGDLGIYEDKIQEEHLDI